MSLELEHEETCLFGSVPVQIYFYIKWPQIGIGIGEGQVVVSHAYCCTSSGMDSEDVLLLHKVNCVLPVDLYDTTGDGDLHINEEVVKAVTLVSNQKCKDPCTSLQLEQAFNDMHINNQLKIVSIANVHMVVVGS